MSRPVILESGSFALEYVGVALEQEVQTSRHSFLGAAAMKRLFLALLLALTTICPAPSQDKDNEGFVPMFNGKDLTGWVNVNGDPSTFFVKDNMIITTGKPTGFLRTAKQYEN